MIKLTINDYFSFVKKNKLLFFLVSLGLFVISFMSLFLIDTIRYNLFSNLNYEGTTSIAYLYKEPVSSKDVYEKLKKVGISSTGVMLVSEQAYNNELDCSKDLVQRGVYTVANKILEVEELGIVGYKISPYFAQSRAVHSGRYFNSSDIGKMNCIIHESAVLSDNDDEVIAEDYEFSIVGVSKLSEEQLPYDHTSVIVTPETFAMLDIPLKIIQLQFVVPPTESHANKIFEVLNSFGEYEKTPEPLAIFSLSIVIDFITASSMYLAALGIITSMLILVFKCWIGAQQGVFKIYSICGITDNKVSLMRKIQISLFYVPIFIFASISYVALTLLNYKKFVYNLIPQTFIINFIVILVILFILSDIQNRKNSGFAALRDI